MSIALEVRNRINSFDYGAIIKYGDLIDITDNVMALSKALSRMVQDNKLEKVEKGVFYKPKVSKFGKVGPNINEIINKELEKDGKIVGYITGVNLYNKLGLTTQISNEIEIATNKRKTPKEIFGKKIRFIKVDSQISKNTVELLQILDAIKNIKKIPDGNLNENYVILKERVGNLTKEVQAKIKDLALDYSPFTRALIGSILEDVSKVDLSILENSLNPFTKFNINISEIKNKKRWNIDEAALK